MQQQPRMITAPRAPTPSTWICPQCETVPPLADNPQFPFGTPAAHVIRVNEDSEFRCIQCINAFQTAMIRANVPILVKRVEYEAFKAEQAALETPEVPEYKFESGPQPQEITATGPGAEED